MKQRVPSRLRSAGGSIKPRPVRQSTPDRVLRSAKCPDRTSTDRSTRRRCRESFSPLCEKRIPTPPGIQISSPPGNLSPPAMTVRVILWTWDCIQTDPQRSPPERASSNLTRPPRIANTEFLGACKQVARFVRPGVGPSTHAGCRCLAPVGASEGTEWGRPLDPRPALRSDLGYRISARWASRWDNSRPPAFS